MTTNTSSGFSTKGGRALDLADVVDQPLAPHLQHAGDLGQAADARARGAAAQDVVDEGAVHAGHLGDMGGRQAELMGADPQAVGQCVLLGHVSPRVCGCNRTLLHRPELPPLQVPFSNCQANG
ncbi:hypothetical protein IT41_19835 [Paracoccus halophilus]|uniref:Uncharacterized protein n=1 Tax=Paracoccus halophilus TaxID=376733 RepID=A0A099EUH3_9RHOB|nr:hypothetical protein IT41_19835 [Paracoccus halophilus]